MEFTETGSFTVIAVVLWAFYVLVEVVQFTISMIEIIDNLKSWWRRVFSLEQDKSLKLKKVLFNFYFPIPTYLKDMENWLQLLIIMIR